MALFSQVGRYTNFGLFIMRAGLGGIMILYGLPILTHSDQWADYGTAMGNLHVHFFPAFWGFMFALTETIGGLFLILGLWFRLVCLLLLFSFIVAALTHFSKHQGIEAAAHALELCFTFAGLFFVGPGKYSVDRS